MISRSARNKLILTAIAYFLISISAGAESQIQMFIRYEWTEWITDGNCVTNCSAKRMRIGSQLQRRFCTRKNFILIGIRKCERNSAQSRVVKCKLSHTEYARKCPERDSIQPFIIGGIIGFLVLFIGGSLCVRWCLYLEMRARKRRHRQEQHQREQHQSEEQRDRSVPGAVAFSSSSMSSVSASASVSSGPTRRSHRLTPPHPQHHEDFQMSAVVLPANSRHKTRRQHATNSNVTQSCDATPATPDVTEGGGTASSAEWAASSTSGSPAASISHRPTHHNDDDDPITNARCAHPPPSYDTMIRENPADLRPNTPPPPYQLHPDAPPPL